jgi:hypothetical protein
VGKRKRKNNVALQLAMMIIKISERRDELKFLVDKIRRLQS